MNTLGENNIPSYIKSKTQKSWFSTIVVARSFSKMTKNAGKWWHHIKVGKPTYCLDHTDCPHKFSSLYRCHWSESGCSKEYLSMGTITLKFVNNIKSWWYHHHHHHHQRSFMIQLNLCLVILVIVTFLYARTSRYLLLLSPVDLMPKRQDSRIEQPSPPIHDRTKATELRQSHTE
jgi:hypothetical protein